MRFISFASASDVDELGELCAEGSVLGLRAASAGNAAEDIHRTQVSARRLGVECMRGLEEEDAGWEVQDNRAE
jgi:hypothetical protein